MGMTLLNVNAVALIKIRTDFVNEHDRYTIIGTRESISYDGNGYINKVLFMGQGNLVFGIRRKD